jgi:hypothetical protein
MPGLAVPEGMKSTEDLLKGPRKRCVLRAVKVPHREETQESYGGIYHWIAFFYIAAVSHNS